MLSKTVNNLLKFLTLGLLIVCVESFTENDGCECGQQTILKEYIINGRRARQGSQPWLATLFTVEHDYLCGGSIISNIHVLTAAHCVVSFRIQQLYARVGLQDQDILDGERHNIDSWIVHPEYVTYEKNLKKVGANNDIAIIRVNSRIHFKQNIWPICLNDQKIPFSSKLVIMTGFGSISCDATLPRFLQTGLAKVSPPKNCKASAIGSMYNASTMICVLSSHVTPFQGDSGGPLVFDTQSGYFMQIGIVSFSTGCNGDDSAIAFTRVSKYYNWIQEHTKDGVTCSVPY